MMATVDLRRGDDGWAIAAPVPVAPYASSDPDSQRIWWSDTGVHQNLTFPVHPDPISGMHCWHQAVRYGPPTLRDHHGDIAVDTGWARAVYQEWLRLTRPATRGRQTHCAGRPGSSARSGPPPERTTCPPRDTAMTASRHPDRPGTPACAWVGGDQPATLLPARNREPRAACGDLGRTHRRIRPRRAAARRDPPRRARQARRRGPGPRGRVLAGDRTAAAAGRRSSRPPAHAVRGTQRGRGGGARARPPANGCGMPARYFFSSICGPGHPAISQPSSAWACRRWPRGRGSPWRLSAGKHTALRGPPPFPLALRAAPAPIGRPENRGQLLDALIAPARSGVLLTREDLRQAAAVTGSGTAWASGVTRWERCSTRTLARAALAR